MLSNTSSTIVEHDKAKQGKELNMREFSYLTLFSADIREDLKILKIQEGTKTPKAAMSKCLPLCTVTS